MFSNNLLGTTSKVVIIIRLILLLAVGAGLVFGLYKAIGFTDKYTDILGSLEDAKQNFSVAKRKEEVTRKKLKEIEKRYGKLLKQRKEDLIAYAELEAKYNSKPKIITKVVESIVTVDGSTDSDSCVVGLGELPKEKLSLDFTDGRLSAKLNLERIEANKWKFGIEYKLTQRFKIEVLHTKEQATGKENLLVSLKELDEQNLEIGELEVTEFNYSSKLNIQSGMRWWDPAITLGIHQPAFSQYGWLPVGYIAFSFSKYYFPNKEYPGLRFFQLGIGINARVHPVIIFTPVLYNLGNNIPLIKDLWVGVDATIDFGAQFSVGISISTTL